MVDVTIEPVEKPEAGFRDTHFRKEDWEKAVAKGSLVVPMSTAMEAIRNSKGMYRIKVDVPTEQVAVRETALEDMDTRSLKLLAMQAGINLGGRGAKKQIARKDLIEAINLALEKIDIVEDDEVNPADPSSDEAGDKAE